jgi:hypothetical protein
VLIYSVKLYTNKIKKLFELNFLSIFYVTHVLILTNRKILDEDNKLSLKSCYQVLLFRLKKTKQKFYLLKKELKIKLHYILAIHVLRGVHVIHVIHVI